MQCKRHHFRAVIALIASIALIGCAVNRQVSQPPPIAVIKSASPAGPYVGGQPYTRPAVRPIEVWMMGPIGQIRGVRWPETPGATPRFSNSAGIEEPVELTIHLPCGRSIKMRTRPILFLDRLALPKVIGNPEGDKNDSLRDVLLEIKAPPEGEPGTEVEKVREAEKFMRDWGVAPDKGMRRCLNDLAAQTGKPFGVLRLLGKDQKPLPTPPPSTEPDAWHMPVPRAPIGGITENIGKAHLDPYTDAVFRFTPEGPHKYSLVIIFEATELATKPYWDEFDRECAEAPREIRPERTKTGTGEIRKGGR